MNEEPEIRMITPDPVIMEKESGRQFEVLMGRTEKFKISQTPSLAEGEEPPEETEPQYEERWVNYKFIQSSSQLNYLCESEAGVLKFENLQFMLDD